MGSPLLQALNSGDVLLMDGAMGTELQRAGLPEGECGEAWNLTHPDRVMAIHRAYVAAGAEVVLTNTFQSNMHVLISRGQLQQSDDIRYAGVTLAREAAEPPRLVLVSLGPGEWHWLTSDRPCFYAFQNADGLLLETLDSLHSVASCIEGQQKTLGPKAIPILVSVAFYRHDSGQLTTFLEQTPEEVARDAEKTHGIAALGVNCGRDISMNDILEIVRRYRCVTNLPLFARPNAGTPTKVNGHWRYSQAPEQMAEKLPELLKEGLSMIGGCCGTTPEHIAAFGRILTAQSQSRQR